MLIIFQNITVFKQKTALVSIRDILHRITAESIMMTCPPSATKNCNRNRFLIIQMTPLYFLSDFIEILETRACGSGLQVRQQQSTVGRSENQPPVNNVAVSKTANFTVLLAVGKYNLFVWRSLSWSWCSRKVHGKRPCNTADDITLIWPYWAQMWLWQKPWIKAQQPRQRVCGLVCALSLVTGFG